MLSVASSRRLTGWLALAALALQFVLSFGHVHLDSVRAYRAATATTTSARVSQLPAQQPGDDGNDYCAICATIYLAANSFVPHAPKLPVPFTSRPIEHFAFAAVGFITSRRAAFQSRAPPAA